MSSREILFAFALVMLLPSVMVYFAAWKAVKNENSLYCYFGFPAGMYFLFYLLQFILNWYYWGGYWWGKGLPLWLAIAIQWTVLVAFHALFILISILELKRSRHEHR